MRWSEYIAQCLKEKKYLDDIIYYKNNNNVGMPPFIKVSVLILNKLIKHNRKLNIMVFPEKEESFFLFTLIKLLYNIADHKITGNYDVENFIEGEKLKYGNVIVEFIGIEESDKGKFIKIKLADVDLYKAGEKTFPFFQKTTTNRKLSKYSQFIAELNAKNNEFKQPKQKEKTGKKRNYNFLPFLKDLSNNRTYMNGSIMYMTTIKHTTELLSSYKLYNKKIEDLLLIGKVDEDGVVVNLNVGQLEGTPAIVITSNLYSIVAAARKNYNIQSIIIDASSMQRLLNMLDALDELIKLNVPITILNNTENSFDLKYFLDRKFSLWRWNKEFISYNLIESQSSKLNLKLRNCIRHEINYLESEKCNIDSIGEKLYLENDKKNDLSPRVIDIYVALTKLYFFVLRLIIPLEKNTISEKIKELEQVYKQLESEKRFISETIYENLASCIITLKDFFESTCKNSKIKLMEKYIAENGSENLNIIIDETIDTFSVVSYWSNYCKNIDNNIKINVYHPKEYIKLHQLPMSSRTLICGWFKRNIMERLIYSYTSFNYIILLYQYETTWKNIAVKKWNNSLNCFDNINIIKTKLSHDIDCSYFNENVLSEPVISDTPNEVKLIALPDNYQDEIDEVPTFTHVNNNTIKDNIGEVNSYYNKPGDISATPVYFYNNYFATYSDSHKLIRINNIINKTSGNNIEIIKTKELRCYDILVERQADKDLIKDMAEKILKKNNQIELIKIANLWKIALRKMQEQFSEEHFYVHFRHVGCKRNEQTVHKWLTDDEMISPQSKQDLEYIAKVVDDKNLYGKIDEIFSAAEYVKSAHIQAGKELSALLRKNIGHKINNINTDLIQEDCLIEDVGLIKILKVKSIGERIKTDAININKIMSANKERN